MTSRTVNENYSSTNAAMSIPVYLEPHVAWAVLEDDKGKPEAP
jgi:hypothetical protein